MEMFYGKIPKYLIMAMVSSAAFGVDYSMNPYNFKHFNVKYLNVTRDGENLPFEVFEPDFRTSDCLKE